MILPMMGLLFALIGTSLIVAVGATFVPRLRRWRVFALVPLAAALAGFVFSWGLAIALEEHVSESAGGMGFLVGYAAGVIGGAAAGAVVAARLRTRVAQLTVAADFVPRRRLECLHTLRVRAEAADAQGR